MAKWTQMKAKDFLQFNPKYTMRKGTIATKIAMDCLEPFSKFIAAKDQAAFNGGTKFMNGDTILARITPCLENGKTAFVDVLGEDEVGFGSTEFIVMQAKKGISDPHFVYYLATSPFFRSVAIKSMNGSSGRQRVQLNVLEELEINVPDLDEQKRIADILSALDSKIDVNNRINDNLQQQVSLLYDALFLSKTGDCRTVKLGDIASVSSGKRPKSKFTIEKDGFSIPIVGAASVVGYTNEALHEDKILVTGRVGTHGVMQRFKSACWPSDNTLVIKSEYYEFVYQSLKRVDFTKMNRGSTQPLITQTDLKNLDINVSSDIQLQEFEQIASELMAMYDLNLSENTKLAQLRDGLLKALITSG